VCLLTFPRSDLSNPSHIFTASPLHWTPAHHFSKDARESLVTWNSDFMYYTTLTDAHNPYTAMQRCPTNGGDDSTWGSPFLPTTIFSSAATPCQQNSCTTGVEHRGVQQGEKCNILRKMSVGVLCWSMRFLSVTSIHMHSAIFPKIINVIRWQKIKTL
jgi:hypothetical protein